MHIFHKAHRDRQKQAKVSTDVSRECQVRESNSQPLLFRVNRSWHNKKPCRAILPKRGFARSVAR